MGYDAYLIIQKLCGNQWTNVLDYHYSWTYSNINAHYLPSKRLGHLLANFNEDVNNIYRNSLEKSSNRKGGMGDLSPNREETKSQPWYVLSMDELISEKQLIELEKKMDCCEIKEKLLNIINNPNFGIDEIHQIKDILSDFSEERNQQSDYFTTSRQNELMTLVDNCLSIKTKTIVKIFELFIVFVGESCGSKLDCIQFI